MKFYKQSDAIFVFSMDIFLNLQIKTIDVQRILIDRRISPQFYPSFLIRTICIYNLSIKTVDVQY